MTADDLSFFASYTGERQSLPDTQSNFLSNHVTDSKMVWDEVE